MGAAQLMPGLSGKWRKDRSASQGECYSRQLDLLGLGGVQKACAEKLINGLYIDEDEQGMRVEYKVDKVPFFKHSENFRLGQEVTMGRRDKKAGQQHATLRKLPGAVHVDIQLDGPDTGSIQETFMCPEEGVLKVESVTTVGDRSEKCVQVYRRQ